MRKSQVVRVFLLMVLSVSSTSAPAGPVKPGDTLKYKYSVAWIEPVAAATPTMLLKAYKLTPKPAAYSFTFTVLTDRVDADGIAHAIISPQLKVHIRGWSFTDFEGNVMPDGEIVPKYDLTMLKGSGIDQNGSTVNRGYHPQTHEESVNFSAFSFTRRLSLLNDVALGAGKKTLFKVGDAWRIEIPDKDDEVVNFNYQGMQSYHGHDVAALGFTTTRMTQNGVAPVTGTALYDVHRNVVTMVHWVGDEDTPTGVRTLTVDIALE